MVTLMASENVMRQIRVEKITLNIGTGIPGEKLEKAVNLLSKITSRKPVVRKTKKRIPAWNVRPGLEIGTKVTLRGEEANILLERLLKAKKNILKRSSFDECGNFAFGIPEYLDIPQVEYDASIGIIGLEVAVTLERPGYRIKQRVLRKKKLPRKHQITSEEAVQFVKEKFGVSVGA